MPFPGFPSAGSHASLPVGPRAMVFAHTCLTSTTYTLLSWLPTYFKETFPDAKVCVGGPRAQPRRHLRPLTRLFLQGWVYNVVPWLCAIPLAVGGGYVSDVLINKGAKPAAVLASVSFCDPLKAHFRCRLLVFSQVTA